MNKKNKLIDNLKQYHFEFRHLTVLFVGLIVFQIILSMIHKTSLKDFVDNTQEWYQKHSAERFTNQSTTTLELLFETASLRKKISEEEKRKIIQFFDATLNQQLLQQNVEEIILIIDKDNKLYPIKDGKLLYEFIFEKKDIQIEDSLKFASALTLYKQHKDEMKSKEHLVNLYRNDKTYYTFVPFTPDGKFLGALYMKNTPDLSFITKEIVTNYEETSIIYSALFLLGLLAMYYISTYTVKERDEAQKLLLEEHEINIKKQIDYEKEALFTKRIYHTHHKAEKIMGFIKEDLRKLNETNIHEIKERVTKYSNFVSRVIYDMKWYDPPIQTIRNPVFRTDPNNVLRFLVENIFNRNSTKSSSFEISLDLDPNVPVVPINEFVIWEIVEPLIQNSIDHASDKMVKVIIETSYNTDTNITTLKISDNGKGISEDLLEKDDKGIKKLFWENITTKTNPKYGGGYGCYIAYEISKQRCGWNIDVENLIPAGCCFTITIPH